MGIQLKRSTTATLNSSYVLQEGQIGIEMPSSTNASSQPFRFKIGDGSTPWSGLPYAAAEPNHTHSEYLSTTGTAAAATKLASSRTIRVNLGSTSSASFDGTSNITPGVTGTLPVTRGGTGVTSIDALKTALGVGSGGGLPVTPDHLQVWKADLFPLIDDNSSSISQTLYIAQADFSDGWLETYIRSTLQSYVSSASISLNADYHNQETAVYATARLSSGSFSGLYGSGGSDTCDLGNSGERWKAVYAKAGSIQTSDRSAKHAIHYISDSSTSMVSEDGELVAAVGLPEIIEFIQTLEPATFVYNDATGNKATDDPSNRQLGLIADDIESLTLFPYIGGRYTWEETKDTDGNVRVPAGSSLALKPIPLAVAALTACKYLLQRLEIVEDKLAS